MAPITEASIRKDAFRVQTTYPVVAYQFSPYCCNYSFSNDASLLLPTNITVRITGSCNSGFIPQFSPELREAWAANLSAALVTYLACVTVLHLLQWCCCPLLVLTPLA